MTDDLGILILSLFVLAAMAAWTFVLPVIGALYLMGWLA